ncbi:hypothetical protein [Marinobacter sp. C2H3]|uniref:hypothetical protein n=1 Tax=Marinobacter sp. C2H3 TaxID=3119003 RepID=UPI00300EC0EC
MRDLEIYIRDLQPGAVSSWLAAHVDGLALDDSDPARVAKGQAMCEGAALRITLYPGAFGKRYTCVLLEGERVPWNSDLDCARSAWRAMDTEIRCSVGDWKDGDPVENDTWWRLDQRGEAQVVWH